MNQQRVRSVAIFDGVVTSHERITESADSNKRKINNIYLLLPLGMDGADWLPCLVLKKLQQLTVTIGSYMFMSRPMIEATRL